MSSPSAPSPPARRRPSTVFSIAQLVAALVCLQLAAVYALHDQRSTFLILFAVSGVAVGFACRHFTRQARRHFEASAITAAQPRQAMSMALLHSVMALLTAVVVIQLLLPLLDALTGQTLTRTYLRSSVLPLLPVVIAVLTGLAAGRRPIVPTTTAVEHARLSFAPALPRGLVVFPFAVSIFLIATTLAVGALLDRPSVPSAPGPPAQGIVFPGAGMRGSMRAPQGPAGRAATRSGDALWNGLQAPCPPAEAPASTVRSDTCLRNRASAACTRRPG